MKNRYDDKFFEFMSIAARESANIIVPLVIKYIQPKSIIDIGTGTGTWLKVFKEHGVKKVLGYDGDYLNIDKLEISNEEFRQIDLESNYIIKGKFDLSVSLEVAEHLSPSSSRRLIKTLTELSDTVLFSAAPPLQGGTGHINERPLSYWVNEFSKYGYKLHDIIRPVIWNEKSVLSCYRQNIVIFSSKDKIIEKEINKSIIDIMHPDILSYRLDRYDTFIMNIFERKNFTYLIELLNNMIDNVKDLYPTEIYFLARCYKEVGNYQLAIENFAKYLRYNEPKYKLSTYFHLGECYYFIKNFEKAKIYLEKCLELTNGNHKNAIRILDNINFHH